MSSPKIKTMHFHEVKVPANPGVVNSKGLDKPLHMLPVGGKAAWSVQFDELPKLVMRMELNDGSVAFGEFYRDHNWSTIESIARNLIGMSLMDLVLQDLPMPLCREYDGFEVAIWDAQAKHLGVPLYALLGGKLRDKVKVGAWSSHRTLEEIGPYAKSFWDRGFDNIKLKSDLDDDVVGWCKSIKDHAPEMTVTLDPNQRWETAGQARSRLAGLAEVGNVIAIEDPIPRWQLDEYKSLRQFSPIPIYLHVSLPYIYQGQRPFEAVNALQHFAVDGFNFNGSIAKFMKLATVAEIANLPCWHGSECDLGILEASYLHKAAASKTCIMPSDIFGRLIRSHDLLETPLNIQAPYAKVPTGAGLGVELDISAVKRYQISERSIG